MAIGAIMMIGLSLVQSLQEQAAIEESAELEQDELTRQQEEANLIAQEDRSARVNEADRQAASMMAGMEATGGAAGSGVEGRLGREVASNAGLDLARIEGNRRSEVGAIQGQKKASAASANQKIQQSQTKFLSSAISAGTGFTGNTQAVNATKAGNAARVASARSTTGLGSRAQ